MLLFWVAALFSVATAVYTYRQLSKMQKKNAMKPSQLDGSIADEGVSFHDIAGSPHLYGNNVEYWNFGTEAIKSEGGKK